MMRTMRRMRECTVSEPVDPENQKDEGDDEYNEEDGTMYLYLLTQRTRRMRER